jgi:hypothetical protein
MLPVLGSVVSIVTRATTVMTIAGTAGTGYGLGLKYGRIACQWLDNIESKVTERMNYYNKELE